MPSQTRLPATCQSADIFVPTLHSLTQRDISAARSTLPVLGLGWDFDTMVDYEGDRSILISPSLFDDEDTSFVLFGRAGRVQLGMVANDDWVSLGRFACVEDAMFALASVQLVSRR
jgi:hypothetical protein